MKEVDCVHSMGVSSHSSNTLDCQRTVNSLSLGGEETLLTVMLVIEQMDIKYDHIFQGTAKVVFALSFYSNLDFVTRIGTVCCL